MMRRLVPDAYRYPGNEDAGDGNPAIPQADKKETRPDTKQHDKSAPCGFQPVEERGSCSDSG